MENQNVEKALLRVGEATRRLGISRSTLNRWCEQGVLSPVKIKGSLRRFRAVEIEALAKGAR